jgi:hypothetical protein
MVFPATGGALQLDILSKRMIIRENLTQNGKIFFCFHFFSQSGVIFTHIYIMNNIITTTIDFFYPLAKKVMPLQTFRYAACGCCNVVLDIGLYFISYNFILHKQIVELGFIALQPHVAAFIISLSITIPVGF